MRLPSGRYLLRTWLSVNTRKTFSNTKVRFYASKPIVLTDIIKTLKPFGKIVVDLPYDVEIKATSPHEYPDMDTILVKLVSNEDPEAHHGLQEDLICVNITNEVCDIRTNEGDKNVAVGNVKCLIQTPVYYDVSVRTSGDGSVKVDDMISDSIIVQTEYGNITGSKLQGKEIILSSSEGGSVTLEKSVTGDIEINTAKNGFVSAEKCLGTNLDISTESGSIELGSNYCEKATFTTFNGNLNFNNLHMDNTIDISGNGNLNISCLDGSLQANIGEGSTKIQVTRIMKDSIIKSTGNISLMIPESLDSNLTLKAPTLEIDQSLRGTYDDDRKQLVGKQGTVTCAIESDKKIEIKQSNWMEAFKLQNTPSKVK